MSVGPYQAGWNAGFLIGQRPGVSGDYDRGYQDAIGDVDECPRAYGPPAMTPREQRFCCVLPNYDERLSIRATVTTLGPVAATWCTADGALL